MTGGAARREGGADGLRARTRPGCSGSRNGRSGRLRRSSPGAVTVLGRRASRPGARLRRALRPNARPNPNLLPRASRHVRDAAGRSAVIMGVSGIGSATACRGFFVAAARCVGVQRARARAVAPSVPHPPQVRSSRRSAAGRASQRGAAPWADGAHVRHARRSLGRLLASALAPARVWRVPCCLHRRRWWSGVKLAGHTRHVEVRLRSQLAVQRVARVLVRGLAGRG